MNRFKIYAFIFAFLSWRGLIETIKVYNDKREGRIEFVIMTGLFTSLFLYLTYRNWKKSN
jgi:uncharacterized protein with PQ loop repeat